MAIINISTISPGLANVTPQQVFLYSNDTYAEITSIGYLNNVSREGNPISNGAFIFAIYGTTPTNGIFTADVSNGVITLNEYIGQGNVQLPVSADQIAVFKNSQGTIGDTAAGDQTHLSGQLFIGGSTNADYGALYIYSGNNTGNLKVEYGGSPGNVEVDLFFFGFGQATALEVNDPGTSTASIAVGPTTWTAPGDLVSTGTKGLIVDSGIAANKVLTSSITNPDPSIDLVSFDVTVGFAAITSGPVTLYASSGSKQYKLVNLWMNGASGTNFVTGDYNFNITDGTTVYSVIPSADLLALVNATWGDTALPSPAATGWRTSTAAGANLQIQLGTGTTNYTAGSVVISGILQRVA